MKPILAFAGVCFLIAAVIAGPAVIAAPSASAALEANTAAALSPKGWDALPNGILGRVASFDGRDGVKVAGYIRRPAGDGPFPLVIVLHGGAPTAHATAAADAEALRASQVLGRASNPPIPNLLAQGWAVYTIDFRPNPRYMIDPFEWDDTLIALRNARLLSFVDPKRIALYGGSHGAHIVARVISRADVACAVLCAPAGLDLVSLSRLFGQGVKIGANQRLIREYEQREGRKLADVEKNPSAAGYTSPLTEALEVRCPILLISGRNDPNAPTPVMDAYVEKVRSAGRDVEVWHPDNGPHGFYVGLPKTIPETAEATQRTLGFLRKYLDAK